MEVERRFGFGERLVEFGLETGVGFIVAQEVVDEEGEHAGGCVGASLDGEERVHFQIIRIQFREGRIVFTEL